MIEGLLSENNVDISFWSFDVSTLSGYVQIRDEDTVHVVCVPSSLMLAEC